MAVAMETLQEVYGKMLENPSLALWWRETNSRNSYRKASHFVDATCVSPRRSFSCRSSARRSAAT
jgi:hypothetical protein